jgi:iron(III) transport system ATP-binding protein
MNALEITQLSKHFPGTALPAVDNISLSLPEGEILALVGPSGCGKTTTLRLVAGLERPDNGEIRLKGQVVASKNLFVPPEKRGVGMVFQEHALFPHLTVAANVAFGLKKEARNGDQDKVRAMLALVGLEKFAGRYPHELSGGERQRVALARALAPEPVLVLMDEPFSSLDADLRLEIREQVRGILKEMRATAVFVTHDQEEALYMGDRLAVFQRGRLEQVGGPEEIFHAPQTRFVAEFMGNSDFLPGQTCPDGICTEIGLLPQPLDLPEGAPVEIALRADDVNFVPDSDGNALVVERLFRGAYNVYRLQLDSGQRLHVMHPHIQVTQAGTRARVFVDAGHSLAVFHHGRAVSVESGKTKLEAAGRQRV